MTTNASLLPDTRPGTVTLEDGRTLAYSLLGAVGGPVVVVLDGPGSRGLGRATAAAATDLGVTLLLPDRPGFGESSAAPKRVIGDVAADVLALVDLLGVRRFGILGQSGGTPYALHLAGLAGDRCTGLAFIGAISPLGERDALEDVAGPMLTVFKLARRAPWLLRPLFGMVARQTRRDPEAAARRYAEDLPKADADVLADPGMWAIHAVSSSEAVESPASFAAEARKLARDWGVMYAAVKAPVAFWVGSEDHTHPVVMSRRMSSRLGDAPVTVVPGAATFGMRPVYPDALRHAAAMPVALVS
jgi:pimeloyl-ACP methyl ester carboxylesterase